MWPESRFRVNASCKNFPDGSLIGVPAVLRVAPSGQRFRIEIRFSSELGYARGNLIRVMLFLTRMLEKFRCGGLGIETLRREVVTLIAKDAHQFSGECLVEHVKYPRQVCAVRVGHGTLVNVCTGILTKCLHVGQKIFHVVPTS